MHLKFKVLTTSIHAGYKFSPVRWFIHKDPSGIMPFVKIVTANSSLLLTEDHLIPLMDCSDANLDSYFYMTQKTVQARKAVPGRCLVTLKGGIVTTESILAVEMESHRGIYAP